MSKHEDLLGWSDYYNAMEVDPTEGPEELNLPDHLKKARIFTYPCKGKTKEVKHSWPRFKKNLMVPFENKILALLYVNKVHQLDKNHMSFMNLDFKEMRNNELIEFGGYGFIRGY